MVAVKSYDSKQEMFDTVVKGMKKQKGFGTEYGNCAYINETTGNQCALGMLLGKPYIKKVVIPNGLNSLDADDLLSHLKDLKEERPDWLCAKNMKFLTALQSAHDEAVGRNGGKGSLYSFYQDMEEIAKRFRLDNTLLRKTDWGKLDDDLAEEVEDASST